MNAGRQQTTIDWWNENRSKFRLLVSQPVIMEASSGDISAAKKRTTIIERIEKLDLNEEVFNLADFLFRRVPLPQKAEVDALHIAVASVHNVDFILTWNFKHIANASIRSKLEVLTESKGFNLPVICTPEELIS